MAVHQAARFTNNPMLYHERVVHMIARFLKRTKEKGIILTQTSSTVLNVTLMQTLQAVGIKLIQGTLKQFFLEQVMS